MAIAATPTTIDTLADLLDRLGGIPLDRVLFHPPPGTATEADVIAADDHEDRLCELIDGVLVQKAPGFRSRSSPSRWVLLSIGSSGPETSGW
jgi:hypothetical protein